MKELETREQALERLLHVAMDVIGEAVDGNWPVGQEEVFTDIGEDEPEEMTVLEALNGESTFWLDFVPTGSAPHATDPTKRLGAQLVADAQKTRAGILSANAMEASA